MTLGLALLEERGVLMLASHRTLPSLATAVTGEHVRGSWWGHAHGGEIYDLSNRLEDASLDTKLVEGKVTFVAPRRYAALLRVVLDPAYGRASRRGCGLAAHGRRFLERARAPSAASGTSSQGPDPKGRPSAQPPPSSWPPPRNAPGTHSFVSLLQTKPPAQSSLEPQAFWHPPELVSHRYGEHVFGVPSGALEVLRSAEHVGLATSGTHALAVQAKPFAHSFDDVQVVRQPTDAQVYGAHETVSLQHQPSRHDTDWH